MIDGSGRGHIEGGEQAKVHRLADMPEDELRSLAMKRFTVLREKGYAHLDPESAFVQGFLDGWNAHRLLNKVS